MDVRERQEVIVLPDIADMMIDIRVPEAQIGKLAVGQEAALQVDAFPNQPFTGRVSHVASLPEPSPRSQVIRVYIASVSIDGDNKDGTLRPGMNGMVTIDVGTISDVPVIPMPAIERKGDAQFVWKVTAAGPVATEVELGGNNLTHVEVVAGLTEGERVYLVPPSGAQLPSDEEEDEGAEPAAEDSELETEAASAGNGGVASE